MRIATRAAGAVFAAAAMAAVMAPAAGAATTAPAAGQHIAAVNDDHGCIVRHYRHTTYHRCWNDWYEGYGDDGHHDGDDHSHDGDHH
jgi:hypothetical protein